MRSEEELHELAEMLHERLSGGEQSDAQSEAVAMLGSGYSPIETCVVLSKGPWSIS
jgi:hypothetical protein